MKDVVKVVPVHMIHCFLGSTLEMFESSFVFAVVGFSLFVIQLFLPSTHPAHL